MKSVLPWLPIMGVIIAGFFAVLQIRLNNITNARIRWLETLKGQLADFNSEIFRLSMNKAVVKHIDELVSQGHTSNLADEYAKAVNDGLVDQLKVIHHKFDLIRLNLNPKEDLHVALLKVIDALIDLLNRIPQSSYQQQKILSRNMTACSDLIVLMARLTFKLEWEKIKRNRMQRMHYFKYGKGVSIRKEILAIEFAVSQE